MAGPLFPINPINAPAAPAIQYADDAAALALLTPDFVGQLAFQIDQFKFWSCFSTNQGDFIFSAFVADDIRTDAVLGLAGQAWAGIWSGTTTLVAGTKTVNIPGVDATCAVIVTRTGAGVALTTTGYKAVPSTNQIVITAMSAGDTSVNTDVSVVSYIVFKPA